MDVGFISDPHIGHKAIAKLRGFDDIDAYNEEVIRRWNSVVSAKTLIFLIGDATMDNPLYLPLLARLNGRLVFVGGNNDTRRICKLLEQYAEAVVGALEYKGFIVTHIPVHTQEVSRFKGNIHGHTHDRYVRKLTYEPLSVKVKDEPDNRYLNVSWDVLDGYPMSIEKVIEYFNDRKTEFESVKSIKR